MGAAAVYIARGVTSGLYKIGHSGNVGWRAFGLAQQVREPVEVLAACRTRVRGHGTERALHRAFAHLRADDAGRGSEWYRDDGSILSLVAALPAEVRGSFVARSESVTSFEAVRRMPPCCNLFWTEPFARDRSRCVCPMVEP